MKHFLKAAVCVLCARFAYIVLHRCHYFFNHKDHKELHKAHKALNVSYTICHYSLLR